MVKLLTVIGARPQFIKAAAISRAIRNHYRDRLEEIIIHTGQHYDPELSEVFFGEMNIPREKYNLNTGSGGHAEQTARMLLEIDKVAAREKPDAMLLYGDTNSTLAACLVAVKIHLPVIHVEAGVRSYNKSHPEEVNRLICDHMASILFVPSDAGMKALEKEGFDLRNRSGAPGPDTPRVFRCGDIMYDNTLYFMNKAEERKSTVLKKYGLPESHYILATMHRPANVDRFTTLENILKALRTLIETHDTAVVLPLHPRTRNAIEQHSGLKAILQHDRFFVIPPASFLDMIVLEKGADLVITDSGGVQKEAYFMKKPCLIMLEETPWVELVESGNALLVGSDYQKLCEGAAHFLRRSKPLHFPGLYGDGKAAEFICEQIINLL